MDLQISAGEIVGARERQEDARLVFDLPDYVLLAVADGLGGHASGDFASEIAVHTALRVLRERVGSGETTTKRNFQRAFVAAHRQIEKLDYEGVKTKAPASTLICASIEQYSGRLKLAAIGDSLAWLIRDGVILDLAPPQGTGHWVAFAVGLDIGLRPVGSEMQTSGVALKAGDVLVLATDGLLSLAPEEVLAIVTSHPLDPVPKLLAAIEDKAYEFQDNATAIVVSIGAHRAPARLKSDQS